MDTEHARDHQLKVDFEFQDQIDGLAYPTSLSDKEQRDFEAAFHDRLGGLENWFHANGWLTGPLSRPDPVGSRAPSGMFDLLGTDFRVCVSNRYTFASSLLPAAVGQRGRMEFPKNRVAAYEADITHELTHVFFPNGNRLLAEGLAVYLQQKLGVNPAFPNFGKDLDQSVRDLLPTLGPHGLDEIDLSAFDTMATPDDLVVKIGDSWYQDDTTYLIAGSFVQFLIDEFGADRFYKLYMQTRLVPMGRNAGDPSRWASFYNHQSLDDLAARWKHKIGPSAPQTAQPHAVPPHPVSSSSRKRGRRGTGWSS